MPVDQSGENVLFVLEDGQVEAHIQIQYTGDPEQFAWVVPVMAMPEIEVGSDLLFDAALTATVPTFTLVPQSENCDGDNGGGGGGGGCGEFAPSSFGGSNEDQPGPAVRGRAVVGSYEYAVLDGGTAQGVVAWLGDNGFAQNDAATPILEQYLEDGFMFVAFKLRPGTGVDEIHPIVVRYEGEQPCVPIRLTRIAATDDMGVRVFFLGDHRVVPTNYRHVQINPLRINWVGLGSNYESVVSLAVDEDGSDGHGFVTEYAGPSDVIDTTAVYSALWDSEAFVEIRAEELTAELKRQELLACQVGGVCGSQHPLLAGLLQTYLPPPPEVNADVFYTCSSCFEVDPETWDTEGFAQAFAERVIAPATHAVDIVGAHPYLTRMYTTLSPMEMTEDPLFHENETLPSVDNEWTATQIRDCEGPDRIELPDGRVIWFTEDDIPPTFSEMPVSLRVEEVPAVGAPMLLVDRSEQIDSMLDEWNRAHAPAPDGCDCRSSRRLRGSGFLWILALLGLRARRPTRRQ